ncbi:MAG: hypothetical protein AAF447_19465 [Myxococcota bacterium]
MVRSDQLEDPLGNRLSSREPAPGVLHFQASGRLSLEVARRILEFTEGRRTPGLAAFHDWWGVESYDTKARYLLTKWVVTNRQAIREAHVLSRSRLVRMGVSVANISVAGIGVLHDGHESFAEALRKASPLAQAS